MTHVAESCLQMGKLNSYWRLGHLRWLIAERKAASTVTDPDVRVICRFSSRFHIDVDALCWQ